MPKKANTHKKSKSSSSFADFFRQHRVFVPIAFVVIFALAGSIYLTFSRAASYNHICDHGSSVVCVQYYTNVSPQVGQYVINEPISASSFLQNFYMQQLTGMCNHGKVSSNCPFTVGSGLNNHYKNDQIVQYQYTGNYKGAVLCIGNISNDNSTPALQPCNTVNGQDGGQATVFIRNVAGGGGTPNFIENKFWSNYNYGIHLYNTPAWFCSDYDSRDGQKHALNLDSSNAGGVCQWTTSTTNTGSDNQ